MKVIIYGLLFCGILVSCGQQRKLINFRNLELVEENQKIEGQIGSTSEISLLAEAHEQTTYFSDITDQRPIDYQETDLPVEPQVLSSETTESKTTLNQITEKTVLLSPEPQDSTKTDQTKASSDKKTKTAMAIFGGVSLIILIIWIVLGLIALLVLGALIWALLSAFVFP